MRHIFLSLLFIVSISASSQVTFQIRKANKVIVIDTTIIAEEDPEEEEGVDYGTLVYSTGYETIGDIVNGHNQLGQGSISTTIRYKGNGSFRSMVNSNPASNISSGWRSEVQYPGSYSSNNDDIVVEYYVYFETLPTGVAGGLATQWHGNAGGTSGQNSLWISGNDFMVMRSVSSGINLYQCGSGQPCAPGGSTWSIQTGIWYYMRWEIKYASTNTGYVRLYIDDDVDNGIADAVLYYDTGTNVKTSDGTGQYLKIGQNLFDAPTNSSVMYYDDLKVWKVE